MSHKAIRQLIQATATGLADNIVFTYARASDANSQKKKYPFIRLDPINESIEYTDGSYNMTKTYRIGLIFYMPDKPELAEDNTGAILDDMDLLSDKFLNALNVNFNEAADLELKQQTIELKNIIKTPFVKVLVDSLSGWILSFDLVAPDTFDYCAID